MYFYIKYKLVWIITGILTLLFEISCEPLVDEIPEQRACENYDKVNAQSLSAKDEVKVMTWNIRFGCGSEILWFGDACGDRTVLHKKEVEQNLNVIIAEINRIRPDILLLQEVDIISKRSAYIDQMKYIMDRTYFGYGYYSTNWKSQFIPSDGLGRLDEGNAILSVWPMSEGTLYPLPLRNDIDALTKYFYVRESVMSALAKMPDGKSFYVINTHLSAFSTDDTKFRQVERYIAICDELSASGKTLITGGDYNLLPPNADTTDYCLLDACGDEHFHGEGDNPLHKEGSNYTPEMTWLNELYEKYNPSLPLNMYAANQFKYYSHSTDPKTNWNRTLDYLFANRPFIDGSHKVWQEIRSASDHAPVSANLIIQ